MRAFNVHGVSPFSLVQYQRTEPKEEKKESIITKVSAANRQSVLALCQFDILYLFWYGYILYI